jgi:hypothetical protein
MIGGQSGLGIGDRTGAPVFASLKRCREVTGRIRHDDQVEDGIVAAGTQGIERVLSTGKLDARRVSGLYVMDVVGDRLLVLAQFQDGGKGIYANFGLGNDNPLRLEVTRAALSLQFSVPPDSSLESAPGVAGPWETHPGSGVIAIPIGQDSRVFRLRRE